MQACQRSNHDRDKECSDAHLDFHAPNGKSMVLGSQSFCYSASSNIGAATKLFENSGSFRAMEGLRGLED